MSERNSNWANQDGLIQGYGTRTVEKNAALAIARVAQPNSICSFRYSPTGDVCFQLDQNRNNRAVFCHRVRHD